MEKQIDYLFEDPVTAQKYALITIVGPNMPQKCSVMGIKVRGTTDTLEAAEKMAQGLHRIDPDFDIHTIEVGKFVPLIVDPSKIKEQRFANKQLNELVKEHMNANEVANREWLTRKNEMVKQAIKEGKEGVVTTPIIALTSIKTCENRIDMLNNEIKELSEKMHGYTDTFNAFSVEDQVAAHKEYSEMVVANVK
jgi:hypothetical protein